MTKKKPKKPTLSEVKQVVENLIHDTTIVNQKVDSLAMFVNDYVEFKKDDKKFLEHINKKKEKYDAEQRAASESSK